VEGSKKWEFFGETIKFPLECQPSSASDCPAEVLETLTMQKGDVLYVPRGHWHSVVAESGQSLHLTVGIYNQTRYDFLQWLASLARFDPMMRSNFLNQTGRTTIEESILATRCFIDELLINNAKLLDDYKEHRESINCSRHEFRINLT
jgi:ribosomal protein L16 Arg81 hydroxylase